jgi:phosphoserine phosphatase
MKNLTLALVTIALIAGPVAVEAEEALPSWKDGAARQAIIAFVDRVTGEGSASYVPPAQRIAVFDNDGTLWAEQPIYFQLIYAVDQINRLAPEHPEWKTEDPFRSALAGDMKTVLAGGTHAVLELVMASHAGMTSEDFAAAVLDWTTSARHPDTGRLYTDMTYQPMLELLDYLQKNEFKTFIVSGGGTDFMRVFAEEIYGVPPENVIGSSIEAKYEVRDSGPVIVKVPEISFIDDKEGKPVGIYQHIGRRPIFAAGNSDGDFEMLEWTAAGDGERFMLLVHHTDAEREWAYDRESHVGRLDKALDEARPRGWTIVDMKKDWEVIYPFELDR